MKQQPSRHRQPTPDEQHVLEHLTVRPIQPHEVARYDPLIVEHHYLHSAHVVGEHLRYVATYQGQWLALATWCAPAFHLKARDAFIGWSEEQRRRRLALVVNNARLLVLPACHYPNLISRFMKLMLGRLNDDWQQTWDHPLALAETFVDPQLYQGTAYKVSGWYRLGYTAGWKRSAEDFYQKHDRPKQVWVRELVQKACGQLRAPQLPPAWAQVEANVPPRCTAQAAALRSLVEHLRAEVLEVRAKEALAYPIAGLLALIALAMFSGVRRGPQDLAEYAATLSQGQLRALGFRCQRGTTRVRCPGVTPFRQVLARVDAQAVERALLLWQEAVLGPTQDQLVIVDGKTLRHAHVELVSAVNGHGRWLGTVAVEEGSNEIPAARTQLAQVLLQGKAVLADAAHTQVETAQQILFDGGGDYLLTVKDNQKGLVQTLTTLLTKQRFSPSPHAADARADAGMESRPL
jgi:predicted transposase YbfD/YdcC